MLALGIIIVILSLIIFIVWQIIRAVKMQKRNDKPLYLSTNGKVNKGVLSGLFFQLLESLEIIKTSKNIDIIIGRYDFVKELCSGLAAHSSNQVYKNSFFAVVEQYKQMYYDKLIFQEQVSIAENPQDINQLNEFYADNLFRALTVNVANHYEAIAGMKQKKAIQGRYQKIIELCELVKEHIKALSIQEKNKYLEEIFSIRREASTKKETV
jgi:hypothetical protein